MLCNKWFIIILLLIIIIIGLIVISNYKKESFGSNPGIPTNTDITSTSTSTTTTKAISNATTTTAQTVYDGYDLLWFSNTIKNNNNKIKDLQDFIDTGIPIQTIKSEVVEQEYTNNIVSGLNTIVNNQAISHNINNNIFNTQYKVLGDTITDLENMINNSELQDINTKKYNKIKSLNNGLEINLVNTPNTVIKDKQSGVNTSGYMVMANCGCLSVGANDYDIYKCDDKNPKQVFKMEHILNETAYQNNMDASLPLDKLNKQNINYPFAMLKSNNNGNCLTNTNGSLTVQPCYNYEAQRWFPL